MSDTDLSVSLPVYAAAAKFRRKKQGETGKPAISRARVAATASALDSLQQNRGLRGMRDTFKALSKKANGIALIDTKFSLWHPIRSLRAYFQLRRMVRGKTHQIQDSDSHELRRTRDALADLAQNGQTVPLAKAKAAPAADAPARTEPAEEATFEIPEAQRETYLHLAETFHRFISADEERFNPDDVYEGRLEGVLPLPDEELDAIRTIMSAQDTLTDDQVNAYVDEFRAVETPYQLQQLFRKSNADASASDPYKQNVFRFLASTWKASGLELQPLAPLPATELEPAPVAETEPKLTFFSTLDDSDREAIKTALDASRSDKNAAFGHMPQTWRTKFAKELDNPALNYAQAYERIAESSAQTAIEAGYYRAAHSNDQLSFMLEKALDENPARQALDKLRSSKNFQTVLKQLHSSTVGEPDTAKAGGIERRAYQKAWTRVFGKNNQGAKKVSTVIPGVTIGQLHALNKLRREFQNGFGTEITSIYIDSKEQEFGYGQSWIEGKMPEQVAEALSGYLQEVQSFNNELKEKLKNKSTQQGQPEGVAVQALTEEMIEAASEAAYAKAVCPELDRLLTKCGLPQK